MTDISDATFLQPEAMRQLRQRLRRDRQARVGILRNPNQPPKPPARRAPLMGKWPDLRSARRPTPEQAAELRLTAEAPASASDPGPERPAVETGANGRVVSVDVAGLMASVADHGTVGTARTPFAAEYRPDMTPRRRATDRETGRDGEPSVLTAAAWRDDPAPAADDTAVERAPMRMRRSASRWGLLLRVAGAMLGGMALAVLILIGLLGPPP